MNQDTVWDVGVIGCGIAGIYAGYELARLNPSLKVILLEEGQDIDRRSCPMVAHKSAVCVSCASCAIMRGFGGAGAYSDGKYNFTTEFGGWLRDYLPEDEIMEPHQLRGFGQRLLRGHRGSSTPRPARRPRSWRKRRWKTTCTCCRQRSSTWGRRTTSRS